MAVQSHHYWMAEALRQARKGFYSTPPNPRVGCVIVADGKMLAAGWHGYTGGPHAEVNALNSAEIPVGADFYITLEPCSHHGKTPPCVDALIEAKPARVIVAMLDPNPQVGGQGLEKLRGNGIEVITDVLEAEARELNRGFVKRMEQGLPFVSVKMACSLDGRSALKNGISQWITAKPARRDVQLQRARASVILSSAQTVLEDDPALNLRLSKQDLKQIFEVRHPVRTIVDSRLRLSGSEKIFSTPGEIWIYTLSQDKEKKQMLSDRGAKVIEPEAEESGHISLQAMMQDLAKRGINEVHTECGQRLAGALLSQQLADQVVLYLAPHLLGSQARGGFEIGEFTAMEQRKSCLIRDIRQIGDDLRLTLSVNQE
ncbi:MAG: bifunctional diaminohydroxyphosphoribosylaminopyrimidine deaminase/5-amino-6-(5-phosphoribosylamino)uracil reductase RibD [Gammaproteobacteria bacterium]|nr:bifunctional diaminohydroxyphosphoribosylaminopyrimidine deaminase/5-amino-6-(5-phosphoribosylamino)uracil reductase RibD [Gammaproteobacteria bacterium]